MKVSQFWLELILRIIGIVIPNYWIVQLDLKFLLQQFGTELNWTEIMLLLQIFVLLLPHP